MDEKAFVGAVVGELVTWPAVREVTIFRAFGQVWFKVYFGFRLARTWKVTEAQMAAAADTGFLIAEIREHIQRAVTSPIEM